MKEKVKSQTSTPITHEPAKTASQNKLRWVLALALILYLLFKSGFIMTALVNGRPIFFPEYMKEVEKQAGKQALQAIITKRLILQEAQTQNVHVDDKEINEEIKKIEENLTKQGQALATVLQSQQLTVEDLKEQVKMRKVVDKLIGKNVKVSDEEVNKYVETNKEALGEESTTPEARQSIREQLQQQKFNEEFQKWVDALYKKAKIQYFVTQPAQ